MTIYVSGNLGCSLFRHLFYSDLYFFNPHMLIFFVSKAMVVYCTVVLLPLPSFISHGKLIGYKQNTW